LQLRSVTAQVTEVVNSPVTRRLSLRKPQIRDPERPKRPLSAYMSFLQYYRETKGSAQKPKEVLTAAGAEWKGLAAADRRRWDEPYAVKKSEYDAKFKEYVESGKKDAWARDPEKPKRPQSGFFLFSQEQRASLTQLSITEKQKELGKRWNSLDQIKKEPYVKAYEAAQEKFTRDMKAYKESGKEEQWKKKVGIADAIEKQDAALMKKKATEAEAKAKLKAKAAKEKLKASIKPKLLTRRTKLASELKKSKAGTEKAKQALKKALSMKKVAEAAIKKIDKELKALKGKPTATTTGSTRTSKDKS